MLQLYTCSVSCGTGFFLNSPVFSPGSVKPADPLKIMLLKHDRKPGTPYFLLSPNTTVPDWMPGKTIM